MVPGCLMIPWIPTVFNGFRCKDKLCNSVMQLTSTDNIPLIYFFALLKQESAFISVNHFSAWCLFNNIYTLSEFSGKQIFLHRECFRFKALGYNDWSLYSHISRCHYFVQTAFKKNTLTQGQGNEQWSSRCLKALELNLFPVEFNLKNNSSDLISCFLHRVSCNCVRYNSFLKKSRATVVFTVFFFAVPWLESLIRNIFLSLKDTAVKTISI